MITGMENQFAELEKSPFQFHLTGSRAFGNFTKESDYDFFVQDSPELQNFLFSLNYQPEDTLSYITATSVFVSGNVHIQVVPDFERKLAVQNEILRDWNLLVLLRSLDKKQRKYLWHYLLNRK